MSKNIWNKQSDAWTKAVYNVVFIITGKKDTKEKKIKTFSWFKIIETYKRIEEKLPIPYRQTGQRTYKYSILPQQLK